MKKHIRNIRKRSSRLVSHHIENISRKGVEQYQDIILDLLRERNGIYVLKGDDRPYFIGIVGDASEKIKLHLKDWKWDTLSIYFTADGFNIRDLETLILKISLPEGNRRPGKFPDSKDLKPDLRRRVAEAQQTEMASMFGEEDEEEKTNEKEKKSKHVKSRKQKRKKNVLSPYVKKKFEIRFWYKGRLLNAMVEKDGSIDYEGKSFSSPSLAASAITGRTTNGWTVWKFERSPGEWVLLDELRSKKPKSS